MAYPKSVPRGAARQSFIPARRSCFYIRHPGWVGGQGSSPVSAGSGSSSVEEQAGNNIATANAISVATKNLRNSTNPVNVVKATFEGLKNLKEPFIEKIIETDIEENPEE